MFWGVRLERRLMSPFVWACRMANASAICETREGAEAGAAVFAGVLGFFAAFVEDMLAFVGAKWMADAVAGRQASDAGEFGAAVFTVVGAHGEVGWV
jgi:hypothetical protein